MLRLLIEPFRRAAYLFFRAQVKLRVDRGMRVELADHAGTPVETSQDRAARREQAELDLVLHELGEALGADALIRAELRHLAYIEHVLQQKGLRALKRVPLEVLQKAHEQFEGLVTNWEPRGLAMLRSKMAVTVRERQVAVAAESRQPAPVSETTGA